MKKYLLFFSCYCSIGQTIEQQQQASENAENTTINTNKNTAETSTKAVPNKELLIFLSTFIDEQGDWTDPEIFNNLNLETSQKPGELEEKHNETLPDTD